MAMLRCVAGLVLLALSRSTSGIPMMERASPEPPSSTAHIHPSSPPPSSGASSSDSKAGGSKVVELLARLTKPENYIGLDQGSKNREGWEKYMKGVIRSFEPREKAPTFLFWSGEAALCARDEFVRVQNSGHEKPVLETVIAKDVDEKYWNTQMPVRGPRSRERLFDAIFSAGLAIRMAVQGGDIGVLLHPMEQSLTPARRYWSRFEAWIVTGPDSRVQRILRYDATDASKPGTVVWQRGRDKRLGNQPDFTNLSNMQTHVPPWDECPNQKTEEPER